MRIVRALFLFLLVLIVGLIAVGLFLPDRVEVRRSIEIAAEPTRVFRHLDGMRAFNAWSPWRALDADTRYQFSGPETGMGSTMSWSSGKAEVGNGSQTITDLVPNRSVTTQLDFGEQGGGESRFELESGTGGTQVTWIFRAQFGYDLFGRYVGLLLDGMIGPMYTRGLADLKQLVESGA